MRMFDERMESMQKMLHLWRLGKSVVVVDRDECVKVGGETSKEIDSMLEESLNVDRVHVEKVQEVKLEESANGVAKKVEKEEDSVNVESVEKGKMFAKVRLPPKILKRVDHKVLN